MIRMAGAGPAVGMDEYLSVCPMGRLGEAREVSPVFQIYLLHVRGKKGTKTTLTTQGTLLQIADVIVFLCSPMASYVTGQNIPVDG